MNVSGRRIQTARALAQYPEIQDLLRAGHVTVCAIAKVAGMRAPHNKDTILARIRGRTLEEVAAIVAEYKPREMPRDRVKVIAVAVPAPRQRRLCSRIHRRLYKRGNPLHRNPVRRQHPRSTGRCDVLRR